MPAGAAVPETAIEKLLGRYLAVLAVERNLSRFTIRNYESDLRHLLAYLGAAEVDAVKISRQTFRAYIASIRAAGVAPGSVVRRVSTARSFYRWLRLTGALADDPLANVSLPKKPRRLPTALNIETVTRLVDSADGDKPSDVRDRALLELMYGAGVRVSEAASLDVLSLDLEQMTVAVRGKGNKERLVVVGGPARAALERYLRIRNKLARRPTAALFLNRDGGRLSQRRIQNVVREYALKAGIDARVHPHLLRHTFATHLLDGGAELRVVQELMGHASPNTTQIYLHVTEERQRGEIQRSLDDLAEIETARRAGRR
jgi:site-specific recombinase XerD